jgi:hypothetical protein
MKSRNGKPAPKYRFGDRVQFEFGGRIVWGMITEDRGIIGHDGRRVYYVSMPFDPYDSELNIKDEEELEPDTISRVPLEKAEVIGFLKNSGLTSNAKIPRSGSAVAPTARSPTRSRRGAA